MCTYDCRHAGINFVQIENNRTLAFFGSAGDGCLAGDQYVVRGYLVIRGTSIYREPVRSSDSARTWGIRTSITYEIGFDCTIAEKDNTSASPVCPAFFVVEDSLDPTKHFFYVWGFGPVDVLPFWGNYPWHFYTGWILPAFFWYIFSGPVRESVL